jgi:hypothetical protein
MAPRTRRGALTKASTKSLGLAEASALLVVVAFCSIAYGSKPISFGPLPGSAPDAGANRYLCGPDWAAGIPLLLSRAAVNSAAVSRSRANPTTGSSADTTR